MNKTTSNCRGTRQMRPLTTARSMSLVSLLLATATIFPGRSAEAHGHGHHHHNHNHDDHDHRRGRRHVRGLEGTSHGLDGTSHTGDVWFDRDFEDPSAAYWVGDHAFASQEAFRHSGARCASLDPTEDEKAEAAVVHARWRARQGLAPGKFATLASFQAAPIIVPTYAHVVTSGGGSVGDVSDAEITDSLRVLNDAFGGAYVFTPMALTTRTDNSAWQVAEPFSADELAMKTALRVGGPDALNIYFTKPGGGLLGWATFPNWYYEYPDDGPESDGVVCLYSTVPGGSSAPYNLGDTLVHEVGHWLGLFHTFHYDSNEEDGCTQSTSISGQGDWVDDTPPQKDPTFGCPAEQSVDTCPNEPGKDAVENFMNYSDDACMDEFTANQFERMAAMWDEYRKPDGSIPTTQAPTPPGPTPPAPTPPNPIHVINIGAGTRTCSSNGAEESGEDCWLSRVEVTVEGEDGETGRKDPDVATGVTVVGRYQGSSYNSQVECKTDEFGQCHMPAFQNRSQQGGRRVRFTVTGMTKTGATYDSEKNEVTNFNILRPADR